MPNDNPLAEYLCAVAEALRAESVERIDFDELTSKLISAGTALQDAATERESLVQLRNDYVERIAGMAKAVAVMENRREDQEELITLCGSLDRLPVAELLSQYRRISAKFRDAFPTSYGQLRTNGSMSGKRKAYAEYK